MSDVLDLFAEFAVDEAAETAGVWVDYGNIKLKIAMNGNKNYRQRFTKLYKPNERLLKTNSDAAEAKSNEILADVMAHTILKGWEGKIIVEKGGAPVEYSVENAKKALMLPKFREIVSDFSDDFKLFKAVKDEEDEKN